MKLIQSHNAISAPGPKIEHALQPPLPHHTRIWLISIVFHMRSSQMLDQAQHKNKPTNQHKPGCRIAFPRKVDNRQPHRKEEEKH